MLTKNIVFRHLWNRQLVGDTSSWNLFLRTIELSSSGKFPIWLRAISFYRSIVKLSQRHHNLTASRADPIKQDSIRCSTCRPVIPPLHSIRGRNAKSAVIMTPTYSFTQKATTVSVCCYSICGLSSDYIPLVSLAADCHWDGTRCAVRSRRFAKSFEVCHVQFYHPSYFLTRLMK